MTGWHSLYCCNAVTGGRWPQGVSAVSYCAGLLTQYRAGNVRLAGCCNHLATQTQALHYTHFITYFTPKCLYALHYEDAYGILEDMQRIIMNAKQELILVRSAPDNNSYIQGMDEVNMINIDKIIWKMPHVTVSDEEHLKFLQVLNAGTYLPLFYCSWELFEYPVLSIASRHTCAIKTSVQLEAPRFIILAFQTNRRGNLAKDSTVFDNCKLTNARVYLISEFYAYDNLHLQWDQNVISIAYDMYARFRASYYDGVEGCLLSPWKFKKLAPIIVIDCSKQNEIIKSGPIDVRIEFESSANFPPHTTAYSSVLHDRVVNYCALTGIVMELVFYIVW